MALMLGVYLGSQRSGGDAPPTPTLKTLLLSGASFTVGDPAGTLVGTISQKTAGSTITVSDSRLAISGTQLLVGLTEATEGTISAALVETLEGAIGSPKTTPIEVTVSAAGMPIIYSQTFGDGTDENGRTILPLNPSAKRIWVNSATGVDTNSGLTPELPLKTLNAARLKMTNNVGDHVMMAGSFGEWLGDTRNCNGASARYPSVWQCYDPADPLNEDKYGSPAHRAIFGTAQGGITNSFIGNSAQSSNLALRGLEYKPPQVPENIVSFSQSGSNVLLEDCVFHHTGLNTQSLNTRADNRVFRRTSIYGGFRLTGHVGGLFAFGIDGLIFEDCVDVNAGVPMGRNYSRDTIAAKAWTVAAASTGSTVQVLSATGIAAGQQVFIDGLPAGVTVSSIAGTAITLSGAVTIPDDNTPVQFYIGTPYTTTLGSRVVAVTSTVGLANGQYIMAPGIPAGAKISAVGSGQITIDKDVLSAETGVLATGTAYITDIFTHGYYIGTDNAGVRLDRCLTARPASHGIQLRSGGELARSVFMDCPHPVLLGGGTYYGRAYPGDGDSPFWYQITAAAPTGALIVNGVSFAFGTDIPTGATVDATCANIVATLNASTNPAITRIKNGAAINGTPPGFRTKYGLVNFDYDPVANGDAELTIELGSGTTGVNRHYEGVSLSPDPDASNTMGHRPNGVDVDAHHLLVVGNANISPALPRNHGIDTTNTKSGSKFRQSLMAESRTGTSMFLSASAERNQPTILEAYRNKSYAWGDVGGTTGANNYPDQVTVGLHDNTNEPDAPPYTRAMALAAMGFADTDEFLDYAVLHPEEPWAQRWLEPAFAAAGISFEDL